MLASLKIENVAVIEKAEVNFTPGFNVLTGETGAGKSILIDSIYAILGNRTSRELVRSGAQKACIWAPLESIPASVKKQLEKCGYEVTDDLLLYREINAEGKGSCRVNGMPATAAVPSVVRTRQRWIAVRLMLPAGWPKTWWLPVWQTSVRLNWLTPSAWQSLCP